MQAIHYTIPQKLNSKSPGWDFYAPWGAAVLPLFLVVSLMYVLKYFCKYFFFLIDYFC